MRVMVCLPDNRVGGIAVRALALAEAHRSCGIETVFLVAREEGDLARQIVSAGFSTHQIAIGHPSLRSLRRNLRWATTFPAAVAHILFLLKRERIDLVDISGLLCFEPALAATLARKPVVWHLANTLYPQRLVRLVMPFIARTAWVVPISHLVDLYYCKGISVPRKVIIHEPVDVEKLDRCTAQHNHHSLFRRELGVAEEGILVGSVGNITPLKGYEYLIRAVPAVIEECPNVHFAIVGAIYESQSQYVKEIRKLIDKLGVSRNVTLLGYRTDVHSFLAEIDLFVLSSVAEGTPLAILEAMAARKPVIATTVGGIPDQVVHGRTGFLVPPRRPKEIASSLTNLIRDEVLRAQMGEEGYRRAKEQFSLERCARAHLDLYREAVQANARQ